MKIFIIDTYYGDFLKDFYSRNPHLRDAAYEQQKKELLSQCFGTSDFYSKNLRALGHEAEEFIINNEILQKRWAKEHGVKFREAKFQNIPKIRVLFKSDWFSKILEAQISEFRPDIIYVLDVNCTNRRIFAKVKKTFGAKIVGQIASWLPPKEIFDPYDLLISSLPHYVKKFRSWGKKSEYQPLAFEPSVLKKLTKLTNPYEVTHVGGYGQIHNERNEILEEVAKKIKVDFWGYGTDNLKPDSQVLKNYHGQSWGVDMYNVLYNSKITLTKHITQVADRYANNATLFEATGAATLLLTDWKENLGKLFEIGKEVDTYKSIEELIEKIQYYLTHENERTKIAESGQKRALRDHTYLDRAKKMIKMFEQL